jgi:hypothetical protein
VITAPVRHWALIGKAGAYGGVFVSRQQARDAQSYSLVQPNRAVKVQTVSWHGEPMWIRSHGKRRPVTRLSQFKGSLIVHVWNGRRAITAMVTSITPAHGWRSKTARYEGVLWPYGW